MATGGTAKRRRYAWLARVGIAPTIADRRRRVLGAAIDAAHRRSPGFVAVLDAGCGHRSPLSPLRGRIDRLVGADLHLPASPLPYLDEFRRVDLCAREDAFGEGAFDVILSNFAFEHLSDPRAALANLLHWLRPGGHLVLTTVNRRHPFVAVYLWMSEDVRRRLQPHVKASPGDAHPLVGACNDPATLRAALVTAGFVHVEMETVGNLARAWGRRLPTFVLGAVGDLICQPYPSRRSTILVVAQKPGAPSS
jgi:SAM-dependent methyltransferase